MTSMFAAAGSLHYGALMPDPVPPPAKIGQIAPDFTLPSATGPPFRLAEARARGPVVLFFFVHSGTPG